MTIKETKLSIITASGDKKELIQYKLLPENGYILKNKLTGLVIKTFIVVQNKREINNYIEIKR